MTTHLTTVNGIFSDCSYDMPVALTIICGDASYPALRTLPILVAPSSGQVSIPSSSHFRFVLGVLMILSIFVAQERSINMRIPLSGSLNTGSIIVLPLIWLFLPTGTYGQCQSEANINVRQL